MKGTTGVLSSVSSKYLEGRRGVDHTHTHPCSTKAKEARCFDTDAAPPIKIIHSTDRWNDTRKGYKQDDR